MGITYVGGQTVDITTLQPSNQTITFSLTGGLASVPAIGDLVLFAYQSGTSTDGDMTTKAVTSGYTLDVELYANDINDVNLVVFHKVMGSTPDTTLIIEGVAAAGPGVTVQIMVFRGVSSTTPFDVTLTSATGIDTGNVNPPAITPATAGNVIAIFGAAATSTTVRTFTTASTAYMSGFLQNNRAGTNFGVASGAGYVSGQSAGVSYDPAAWAISTDSTGNSWGSVTVALRQAETAISGTASGTFNIAGASSGTALISGASSGDMAISGASIASVLAAASASGMIALSGSALGGSAKILIAAGAIDIAGSATATVQLSAVASGQIDLTGSAQGGVAIVAASSGQIGITGAADGEVSYNTGEASGTLAFTGAAIGAIYVQGSVSGAISFSLASYGKHLWLQQPPTDETWSVQAANSEIWQPVSGSGTAWE